MSESTTPLLLQNETHTIIGICMEVHNHLGNGFLEVVYKDAIEFELREKRIEYQREKEYSVRYKGNVLPHTFVADFVVFHSVILEVKAQKHLGDEHFAQTINYLAASGCSVGLIVNFGESSLKFRRVVL